MHGIRPARKWIIFGMTMYSVYQVLPFGTPFVFADFVVPAVRSNCYGRRGGNGIKAYRIIGWIFVEKIEELLSVYVKPCRGWVVYNRHLIGRIKLKGLLHTLPGCHRFSHL